MFIRVPFVSVPPPQFATDSRVEQGESLFIRKYNSFQEADSGTLWGERPEWS